MGKYICLIIIVGVVLFAAVGCGDDDCPVCPRNLLDRMVVTGYVQFHEDYRLELSAEVMSTSGEIRPELDSMKIAGLPVTLNMLYSDDPQYMRASGAFGSSGFSSGDTIFVVAYTPYGVDSCGIVLLDEVSDSIFFHDWSSAPPDTVDVGTPLEVAWSSLPIADGYRYMIQHVCEEGAWPTTNYAGYQTDTVYSISAEENSFNGWWAFGVWGITGIPPGESTGNVSGSRAVKWNLCCRNYGSYLKVYVGTGHPDEAAGAVEGGAR